MELSESEKGLIVSALEVEHKEYGPYSPDEYEEIWNLVQKLDLSGFGGYFAYKMKEAGYGTQL